MQRPLMKADWFTDTINCSFGASRFAKSLVTSLAKLCTKLIAGLHRAQRLRNEDQESQIQEVELPRIPHVQHVNCRQDTSSLMTGQQTL